MVLANLGSVEHRVEAGDLVNLHGRHLEDLSSLMHGRERQEVVVLLLSDEQDGDASRGLIVVGVLGQQVLDGSIALISELEGTLIQVVLSVAMVGEGAEVVALSGSKEARLEELLGLRAG